MRRSLGRKIDIRRHKKAVDLSINPNTVRRACTELELTGLVETQVGSGTFVVQKPVARDVFRYNAR